MIFNSLYLLFYVFIVYCLKYLLYPYYYRIFVAETRPQSQPTEDTERGESGRVEESVEPGTTGATSQPLDM